jgi:hypothetical protein
MKIVQLLKSLLIGGEPVKAGESVEVSESVARELVGRGVAVPVIAKPEPLEGVHLTKADLTPRHPVFDQEKPAEEPKPRKK